MYLLQHKKSPHELYVPPPVPGEGIFFCYISTISYDTDGTDEPIFEQYFLFNLKVNHYGRDLYGFA